MASDKSISTFNNITLTVWSAGIQVQKKGSDNVTFISKGAIGSLHLVKDCTGSYIRYTPVNFQNPGPYHKHLTMVTMKPTALLSVSVAVVSILCLVAFWNLPFKRR